MSILSVEQQTRDLIVTERRVTRADRVVKPRVIYSPNNYLNARKT